MQVSGVLISITYLYTCVLVFSIHPLTCGSRLNIHMGATHTKINYVSIYMYNLYFCYIHLPTSRIRINVHKSANILKSVHIYIHVHCFFFFILSHAILK
jgi:hypothetical protein